MRRRDFIAAGLGLGGYALAVLADKLPLAALAGGSDAVMVNGVGFVPSYLRDAPRGTRHLGELRYRYFKASDSGAFVREWFGGVFGGMNSNLLGHGVALCIAVRVLGDPDLKRLASRQLNWVLGVNPFAASTVTGVGRNQPPLFGNAQLQPFTPEIDGGVMNGITCDANDEPDLLPGSFQTGEYWTPHVGYLLWLLADLPHTAVEHAPQAKTGGGRDRSSTSPFTAGAPDE